MPEDNVICLASIISDAQRARVQMSLPLSAWIVRIALYHTAILIVSLAMTASCECHSLLPSRGNKLSKNVRLFQQLTGMNQNEYKVRKIYCGVSAAFNDQQRRLSG